MYGFCIVIRTRATPAPKVRPLANLEKKKKTSGKYGFRRTPNPSDNYPSRGRCFDMRSVGDKSRRVSDISSSNITVVGRTSIPATIITIIISSSAINTLGSAYTGEVLGVETPSDIRKSYDFEIVFQDLKFPLIAVK